MRAAVFHKAKAPLEVTTVPDPAPEAGEVLVKVADSGICGSDLHVAGLGLVPAGTVLGHEFSGEIVAVGKGVSGWKEGDRVTALPVRACGTCDACRKGLPGLCEKGVFTGTTLEVPGAYAEYVRARAPMLKRLPDNVSFREGALVEPLSVSYHAVEMAGPLDGAAVLVIGAGPIGAGVALFARLGGAEHVVVSEFAEGRRARALKLGATAAIDPKTQGPAEAFAALTGRPPDVVFECVGLPGLLQQAIELAAVRGRVVVTGVCFGDDVIRPLSGMMKEVSIRFSQTYTSDDFDAVIAVLAKGEVDVAPLCSAVVGLSEVPETFTALSHPGDQCKVLIDPTR